MRSRTLPAVCLLGVVSICLAHDPLPIQGWDDAIDVIAIGNLTIAEDEIEGEAARLPNLDASTEAPCNPAARTAPVPTHDGWTAYWVYEPLYDCGGVMNKHYVAATRLAQKACERLSLQLGVWPPATPIVTAPKSYGSLNHHAGYKISDGPLELTCVAKVVDPTMHETASPP